MADQQTFHDGMHQDTSAPLEAEDSDLRTQKLHTQSILEHEILPRWSRIVQKFTTTCESTAEDCRREFKQVHGLVEAMQEKAKERTLDDQLLAKRCGIIIDMLQAIEEHLDGVVDGEIVEGDSVQPASGQVNGKDTRIVRSDSGHAHES